MATIRIRTTVDKVAEDHTMEEIMNMGAFYPSYTTTQRDALVGMRAGMTILNTTTGKLNFYDGAAWVAVTSA